jgi:multiple sugar transport system permease protein
LEDNIELQQQRSILRKIHAQLTRGSTVFVLPAAFLALIIIAYPFANALWLSFTDHTVAQAETHFIGLKNYGTWIGRQIFWQTILNTLVYAGGTVAFGIVLGFAIGLSLHRIKVLRDVWGAVILLPWIIPTVVSTLVWMWMYNPFAGILNFALMKAGIVDSSVSWLGSGKLAMISVIVVSAWRYTPYFGVVILAARKEIPDEYYEAAVTDGANTVQQFRYITVPAVLKLLFFTSMLIFIRVAYDFVVVYILTRGGPGGATQIISVLTFTTAFESGKMGAGVAAPLLLFPLFGPLILIVTNNLVKQSLGEK